jgi:hypothetical protein
MGNIFTFRFLKCKYVSLCYYGRVIISPAGLGTESNCAGEDQQQFILPYPTVSPVTLSRRGVGVTNNSQTPPIVEEETQF